MVFVDAGTIILLKGLIVFHTLQILESKLYVASLVALGVNGLDGRERGECLVILSRFIVLVDSYHLEGKVTQLDILAYEQPIVFYQFLGLTTTHHNHLSALLHIDLIDESPFQHLYFVDFGMGRINTCQRLVGYIVVAIIDIHTILLQLSAHIAYLMCIDMIGDEHILVVEVDRSSFFQTIVGLRSVLPIYYH